MIQTLEWYSVFPLVTGIMALLLGIAALRKNQQIANVDGFFALMLIFLVFGVLDFIMINASDAANALRLARGVTLCMVLIFAGFLYISTQLAFLPLGKWLQKNRILYSVMSLFIGLIVAYSQNRVEYDNFGYGLPDTLQSLMTLTVIAIFAAATLSLLVRRWYMSDDELVRNECLLLSLTVIMPYLWGLLLFGLNLFNFNTPSDLSPGFFVSIVIIAFAVYRHRLFTIMPVSEDRTSIIGAKEAAVLPTGSYMLFEETKADGMFEMLLSQISNGVEGLIVTWTYPEDLRNKYGLKRTPVIWLCSQPGQDRVDPTNLSILEHTIIEFLKIGHDTVVAVDGLEYLISNNGSSKVLRMLYGLRDEILMNQSRLIITLDPDVLEPRELAFFERDFKVIKKI
ncbi:MAG: DUF835 domain-containing protein [Methanomassiliicoccales archaeon]